MVHIEYVYWNIIHLGIWKISLNKKASSLVIYSTVQYFRHVAGHSTLFSEIVLGTPLEPPLELAFWILTNGGFHHGRHG